MTLKQIRKFAGLLALTIATLGSPVINHAVAATTTASAAATTINSNAPSVLLNGEPLATSIAPQIRYGITMVPMRDIFEALGATVVYVPGTREIRARKDDVNVWLQIDNSTARVGETSQTLTEAPIVYRGSTLVPLRFVSEALGAEVKWDGVTRVVSIETSDRIATAPAGINDADAVDETDAVDESDAEVTETDVRGTITIPAGAVVPVTLDSTLSSKDAKVGDKFSATVKSEDAGDSEFPSGTRLYGRITEAQPLADNNPGVIGLEFTAAELPDGSRVGLKGDLISLDDDSVTQTEGRIMAKPSSGGKDKTKIIGIGAGAGFILGKVLGKNSLITGILGAAGAYLYSKKKDKGKEQEAVVEKGSTLGVKLSRDVSYTDLGYADKRAPYLK